MKQYEVLISLDNGTNKTIVVDAPNAEDARWIAKKMPSVYSASASKRINRPPHKDSGKGYLKITEARKEAFTSEGK